MKESENIYALWCSGRSCVEGMLVELKLLKRQDLVNVLLRLFKPASDQIVSSGWVAEMSVSACEYCFASSRFCYSVVGAWVNQFSSEVSVFVRTV